MRYVTIVWVLCWLATPVVGGDYNAVDKNGVRVFSKVPPVGVHPRVILSPEDLPGWRESVRETYRGREFLAKRYEDGYITALAALDDKLSGKELALCAPPKKWRDSKGKPHLPIVTTQFPKTDKPG